MRPKLNISAAVKKSINLDYKTANPEFSVSLVHTESNIEQNIAENTENLILYKQIDETPPNKSINKPNSNKKSMFNFKKATLKPKSIQTATENENMEDNRIENEENIGKSVKINVEAEKNRGNIEEKVKKTVVGELSASLFNIKKVVEKERADKIVTEKHWNSFKGPQQGICVNRDELEGNMEVVERGGTVLGNSNSGVMNIGENIEAGEKLIAEKEKQQERREGALLCNRVENIEGNMDEIVREVNSNNEEVKKTAVRKSSSRFNIKKAVLKEVPKKIVTVGNSNNKEVNLEENIEVGEKRITEEVVDGEKEQQERSWGALVGNRVENMEENIEESRGNIDEIVREVNNNNEEVRKAAVRKPISSRFNIKKAVLKEVPKQIVRENGNSDNELCNNDKSLSEEPCNSSESLLLRISINTDEIMENTEVGEREIAVEEGQEAAAVYNRVENLEENIDLLDRGIVEKEVEEQGNTVEVAVDNNKHSGVHKVSINVRNAESKHVSTTQIRTPISPTYKRTQQNDNDNASVTTAASSIGNLSSKKRKRNLFVLKNLSLSTNNGDDDVIDTSQMSLKSMINLCAKLPASSKLREQQQKKNDNKVKLNKAEEDKEEEGEKGKKEEEGEGPFRIDVDGNIVVNTVRRHGDTNKNMTMLTEGMTVVVEDAGFINSTYGSFIKRKLSGRRWSLIETDNFYKALFVVGTNFSAMESIFEGRTRNDLKKKFKVEEKLKPEHIEYILMNPQPYNLETIKFDSHIKKAKKRKDAVKRILKCSKGSDSDQSEECVPTPKRRKFSLNPSSNGLNLADGDLPEYF